MTVPFAALSRDEVVLDAHRPSRGGDGGERSGRERCAAEVRLQHDAGRVDDTPERETFAFREGRARLRRERRSVAGCARGARSSEDVACRAGEARALRIAGAGGAEDRVHRWQRAARIGPLHRPRTSSAAGRTRIEKRCAVVVSPSS